jgi:hypothetical protein
MVNSGTSQDLRLCRLRSSGIVQPVGHKHGPLLEALIPHCTTIIPLVNQGRDAYRKVCVSYLGILLVEISCKPLEGLETPTFMINNVYSMF